MAESMTETEHKTIWCTRRGCAKVAEIELTNIVPDGCNAKPIIRQLCRNCLMKTMGCGRYSVTRLFQ